ncbi:hypothetical protein QYF36_018262 [Acer negundo]|nr:hypothetical protein QYF36_018262 [Acer negundo]
MDAQARKKALFRAKLNEKKEKQQRINSPLVRYNDFDQPVCRVCDVVLKSDSLWDAHQASRKHHQAISNLKASAAVKSQSHPQPRVKTEVSSESSKKLPENQSSSVLPSDFFDNADKKKPKTGSDLVKSGGSANTRVVESLHSQNPKDGLSDKIQPGREVEEKPMAEVADSETKQTKGALPEGFFDNKEADLRARGIKIVKPDVKDEYKEFEKLIQEDLQEVDDRMEEDEIDAAEVIEEYELLEQKTSLEKVEMLKKRRMELEAARLAKRSKSSEVVAPNKSTGEDSSSDDDDDGNFAVDWRAQHL